MFEADRLKIGATEVGALAFGVNTCGVDEAGDDAANAFTIDGCDTFVFVANGCVLNACGLKNCVGAG